MFKQKTNIMATLSGLPKKRSRKGVQYHMELNFANDDAKLGFLSRMERAKRQLASRGSPPLDNREVISRLLDRLDEMAPPQAEGLTSASSGDTQNRASHAVPMLEHSGTYTLFNIMEDKYIGLHVYTAHVVYRNLYGF